MSHYLSGIIKIILIEAMLATLVIEHLASDRVERALKAMRVLLAGLMVFAWCNYGALRANTNVTFVVLLVPLLGVNAFMLRAAWPNGPLTSAQARFRSVLDGWAKVLQVTSPRAVKSLAVVLSAVVCCAFVALGHQRQAIELVHPWEQFHFYLGAKYQREVGWFHLYPAVLLADRESAHRLDAVTKIRRIEDFEEVSVEQALADNVNIRQAFSEERWQQFKRDWTTMSDTWSLNWGNTLLDHGNSNSPAWSLLAHPIASLIGLSTQNQSYLGWIDMLLMMALWLCIFVTFSMQETTTGLFFWAVPPLVFDYLSGSFLRWDWLFALGLTACLLKKERWGLAGVFFGYAVATKLFPVFFGIAMLIPIAKEFRASRKLKPEWMRFGAATFGVGALLVFGATLMFGTAAWVQYFARIQVAQHEKFYAIQYSLKTVYLQIAETPFWEFIQNPFFPALLQQAQPQVDIANHAVGFLLIRLFFSGCVAALLWRRQPLEAFLFGPALVFIWLTVNMYYWNMLGLFALGLSLRKSVRSVQLLLGLGASFIFFFVYQHTNRGLFEGYVVACCFALGLLLAAFAEWRGSKAQPAH
jgi:Glycosyltransferase family 87